MALANIQANYNNKDQRYTIDEHTNTPKGNVVEQNTEPLIIPPGPSNSCAIAIQTEL
ncbi:hypothetical protein C427_3001 [Paraglaciecola psychrophila 170]|uniref:Uncharacterized protein n=1 Tax=Paraglaciecola psychrophila 170 TaxID=1129794 RepID=K6ZS50_9ALTE|nr:hypothetical protein C427_3001 [Paraglaciecola psychrophila 170]GAC38746.1 hypothetical protein GPSY_3135 [Paraglaciecola psychrophila 170]